MVSVLGKKGRDIAEHSLALLGTCSLLTLDQHYDMSSRFVFLLVAEIQLTIVGGTREERCTFLRYKRRGRSFLSLMSFIGHLLTQENISGVLTEIPPLISESDLHISQVRTSKETKNR